MKVFNGRSATEEYMSTHSLTFSTPEMTLKKFVLWLSELIEFKGEQVPRIMLFFETKDIQNNGELNNDDNIFTKLLPDVDETFRPTGAVTDMFKSDSTFYDSHKDNNDDFKKSNNDNSNFLDSEKDKSKFCIECGSNLKHNSKFCIKCGTKQ
jgi:hypothetical protein